MAVISLHRGREDEDGESVFVSMTDLTVSFLFIFLVLLAFFATQIQPEVVPRSEYEEIMQRNRELTGRLDEADRKISEAGALCEQINGAEGRCDMMRKERDDPLMSTEVQANSLDAYLQGVSAAREALLERLADRIRRRLPGIQVTVDASDGLIRFRADELFARGAWRIRQGSLAERVSHAVGDAFAETLPCYTFRRNPVITVSCEGALAAIETIQVEGHTDDVSLSADLQEREQMRDNYDLSARRGAETLRVMTRKRPELGEFLNFRGQPVLSFAGYGDTRPIDSADTEEARAQNRRIDIRFILQTPRNHFEVEEIRARLTRARNNLPAPLDESQP